MKKAIVVGSGAGGAMAARELARGFDVTIVEEGPEFRRFSPGLTLPESLRSTRLLVDPRMISLLFPAMRVNMTGDRMALVRGVGTGGTTTLATANALRCDEGLLELGIDLSPEFEALSAELPISVAHEHRWRLVTRELFSACEACGLDPRATPKLVDFQRCTRCGRCVLGCPTGAKWDSRQIVEQAVARGARLQTKTRVERVVFEEVHGATGGATGRATGVMVWREGRPGGRRGLGHREFIPGDVIVLAAGGFGTPRVLSRSGIAVEERLFVDPVLCVAAPAPGVHAGEELPMPFVVQRDGYFISPYFDYLSYFFQRSWRRPRHDIVSLMIKLADSEAGVVTQRGVRKSLTERDRRRLDEARRLCVDILAGYGVRRDSVFLGMLNAGHPGGTLPLTGRERDPLHPDHLVANLYVADPSLLPRSLGRPPMLTIMALARRVAALCLERFA